MSRPWLAAAFVASLIAFAGAYALAAPGDRAPGAVRISHRLAIRHLGPPPASWHKVRAAGLACGARLSGRLGKRSVATPAPLRPRCESVVGSSAI